MAEKLTDEQAEAMLRQLSEHFRVPVQPINRYCAAFDTWHKAQQDRRHRLRNTLYPDLLAAYGSDERAAAKAFYEREKDPKEVPKERWDDVRHLRSLEKDQDLFDRAFLLVRKSNLLARLIYGGQKLRTRMCPEHKGEWSGIEWHDPRTNEGNICPHGCHLTGWLPEE